MTFRRLPFESVFADESGGNAKTPQAEYLTEGEFPIVGQGKTLIGGYTDERERLCGQGRSAIIFGDHTRCIKYIDFPFCMGADGVKVLRPKIEADLKYLYYFLKSLDIPSAGYDRHYKYLKRTEVVLPPLPEQRRLAAILDQADALRAKRREALAQLDSLTQSIFIEMFGDPVRNPKSWQRVAFRELLSSIDSGWSPVCLDRPVTKREWGVLKLGAVTSCTYDPSANKALPDGVASDASIEVKTGDLLFSRKNTYDLVAACAYVDATIPGLMMSDLIFRLQIDDETKVTKRYLHALLTNPKKRQEVQKLASGSSGSMPNISKARLQGLLIELPPTNLQQTFATRIQAIESLKTTHRATLAELDALFASLQQRAFSGQLSA